MNDPNTAQSRHSPGTWCQREGRRTGTSCPTGSMTYPGEAVACGKGIPAGGGERGVCELEREKRFLWLGTFCCRKAVSAPRVREMKQKNASY